MKRNISYDKEQNTFIEITKEDEYREYTVWQYLGVDEVLN